MNTIKLNRKDIIQVTESCIKKILKEGYFDNNQPDKYQSKDKRETYLMNLCQKIGGGEVEVDGYRYFVEGPNGNAQIILYADRNTNGLYIDSAEVSKIGKMENNIDEAISIYTWMTNFLNEFKQSSLR